jgi:hypothetical protein
MAMTGRRPLHLFENPIFYLAIFRSRRETFFVSLPSKL